jgi:hypothetical protein
MLFNIIPLWCLASTAFSSPLDSQDESVQLRSRDTSSISGTMDFATISGVMLKLATMLDTLAAKAKQWDGDAVKGVPLLDASTEVLNFIKAGVTTIKETSAMGLMDSISIIGTEATLMKAVEGVMNAFVEQKPKFDQAYLSIVVFDQLETQLKASQQMVDAIVSKLPSYIPGAIGVAMAQPILDKLIATVGTFNPGGPGAGPSSDSAATPASAAAPTTNPTPTSAAAAPKAKSTRQPKGKGKPPGGAVAMMK